MPRLLLHRGSFSSVYYTAAPGGEGGGQEGRKVVKAYHKYCDLQARHWLNISREVAILKSLKQLRVPGVVQLCGTSDDGADLCLVFEPCAGGDLYKRLAHCGLLSEAQLCRDVITPLLKVLHSLHSLGIIHRDIKPENIFFDARGRLVLGDFGLAINRNQDRPCSRVGTLDYMAPEVLAQPSADVVALRGLRPGQLPTYDSKVDIWALGVLVYESLMGITPFGHPDPETASLNAQFRRPAPLRPGVSGECADFVARALSKQAGQRPGALQLLGHPWVVGHMDANEAAAYSAAVACWREDEGAAASLALIERLTSCPSIAASPSSAGASPQPPEPGVDAGGCSRVDSDRFVSVSTHLQQSLLRHQQEALQWPQAAALKQQQGHWQRVVQQHRQQHPHHQLGYGGSGGHCALGVPAPAPMPSSMPVSPVVGKPVNGSLWLLSPQPAPKQLAQGTVKHAVKLAGLASPPAATEWPHGPGCTAAAAAPPSQQRARLAAIDITQPAPFAAQAEPGTTGPGGSGSPAGRQAVPAMALTLPSRPAVTCATSPATCFAAAPGASAAWASAFQLVSPCGAAPAEPVAVARQQLACLVRHASTGLLPAGGCAPQGAAVARPGNTTRRNLLHGSAAAPGPPVRASAANQPQRQGSGGGGSGSGGKRQPPGGLAAAPAGAEAPDAPDCCVSIPAAASPAVGALTGCTKQRQTSRGADAQEQADDVAAACDVPSAGAAQLPARADAALTAGASAPVAAVQAALPMGAPQCPARALPPAAAAPGALGGQQAQLRDGPAAGRASAKARALWTKVQGVCHMVMLKQRRSGVPAT